MLRFTLTIDVEASRWSSEDEKQAYIKNMKEIVDAGLFKMTVPDWTVKVVNVREIQM